jgi:hypothetical protein
MKPSLEAHSSTDSAPRQLPSTRSESSIDQDGKEGFFIGEAMMEGAR